MKVAIVFSSIVALASARTGFFRYTERSLRVRHPHIRREVPQEHSHEKFLRACKIQLDLNNPDEIQDTVFGLLGAAAAAGGAGKITDPDCLQQATADQGFTNAKAANDIDGMVACLVYRALERNTGAVGLKSVLCQTIQAKNPEIAAITQHQDPASEGAAEINKQIALTLAVQIASVGGDPKIAIESGTFEPGQIGDPTARGNTCDTLDDPVGCIFTQNLLVADVTEEEIAAAVAAAGGAGEGEQAGEDGQQGEVLPPPPAANDTQVVEEGQANNGSVINNGTIIDNGNNNDDDNNNNDDNNEEEDAGKGGKGKGGKKEKGKGKGKGRGGKGGRKGKGKGRGGNNRNGNNYDADVDVIVKAGIKITREMYE